MPRVLLAQNYTWIGVNRPSTQRIITEWPQQQPLAVQR